MPWSMCAKHIASGLSAYLSVRTVSHAAAERSPRKTPASHRWLSSHLGNLLATRTSDECQPGLDVDDVDIERWRAIPEVLRGRLVRVSGIGQVASCDQTLPGPLSFGGGVFDGLEPAGQERELEAGV